MEEYVNDVSFKFAKSTLKSIGSLSLRVDSALDTVVNMLKIFLSRKIDYIVSESMEVLQSKFY